MLLDGKDKIEAYKELQQLNFGIYYGIDSIKESWKQTLKKYEYIVDLCNKFENIGGNN